MRQLTTASYEKVLNATKSSYSYKPSPKKTCTCGKEIFASQEVKHLTSKMHADIMRRKLFCEVKDV